MNLAVASKAIGRTQVERTKLTNPILKHITNPPDFPKNHYVTVLIGKLSMQKELQDHPMKGTPSR